MQIYVDPRAAVVMRQVVGVLIEQAPLGESFDDFFCNIMYELLTRETSNDNGPVIKVLQNSKNRAEILLVVDIGRLAQRVVTNELLLISEPAVADYVPSTAPTTENDAWPLSPEDVVNILYVHLAQDGLLYPGQGRESLGEVDFVPGEQINYFTTLMHLIKCFNGIEFPRQVIGDMRLFVSFKAKEMFLGMIRESVNLDEVQKSVVPASEHGALDLFGPILEEGKIALFRSKADPNLVLCILSDEVDSFPEAAAFDRIPFEPKTFEMDVFGPGKRLKKPNKKEPRPFFIKNNEAGFIPHKGGPFPSGGSSPYMMIDLEGEERRLFVAGLKEYGFIVGSNTNFYCDSSMVIILEVVLTRFRRGLQFMSPVSCAKQAGMMAEELRDVGDQCFVLHYQENGEELFFTYSAVFEGATPPA